MSVKRNFTIILILGFSVVASAQVFVPFAFWRVKKKITVMCESGCYPTPNTPFTAATYYLPIGDSALFTATSDSNPSGYDFCWGPAHGSGCAANAFGGGVTYPLTCSSGTDNIDGSNVENEASYSGTAATTSTCTLTDYGEARASTTFAVRGFTAVSITSPITSVGSPQNICVSQTQAMTATGGIGTLAWSVASGGGSVSPLTGTSSTFTAPATAQSVQVQVRG